MAKMSKRVVVAELATKLHETFMGGPVVTTCLGWRRVARYVLHLTEEVSVRSLRRLFTEPSSYALLQAFAAHARFVKQARKATKKPKSCRLVRGKVVCS